MLLTTHSKSKSNECSFLILSFHIWRLINYLCAHSTHTVMCVRVIDLTQFNFVRFDSFTFSPSAPKAHTVVSRNVCKRILFAILHVILRWKLLNTIYGLSGVEIICVVVMCLWIYLILLSNCGIHVCD